MEKALGNVGSNLLFENDRVAVWDMRLAPGQKEPIHEHKRDYLMIQIHGDRVAADFEPECQGAWAEYAGQRLEADVIPGNVLYSERGGVEAAVNTGEKEFYEIIVELKD
ncbi:hypothetical protein KM427_17660 [Nocardioides sp. LMS-CY]|uniref:Putative metal-dependent enzyme (Double-stranded beta helix superfamily) n=1 Tax=Nocardioides soli TaxID=1036020 RepID=A0A7W4Z1S9_9ACTN|nr:MULTISPECIES: hypothetical protein [Nocardioides]MBB3043729.1 putative metal-dependent enzyme (double-stranded beta helix superfamily) [Nocardioides soli]QWF20782.1 hypothetical protein KM427_17660 [Nocardioides sp. LMS-CY]